MPLDNDTKNSIAINAISTLLTEYYKNKTSLALIQLLRICDNCDKLDSAWIIDELPTIYKQILNKKIYSRIRKVAVNKCKACGSKDLDRMAITTYLKCLTKISDTKITIIPNVPGDTSIACSSLKQGNFTLILRDMKLSISPRSTPLHIELIQPDYIY